MAGSASVGETDHATARCGKSLMSQSGSPLPDHVVTEERTAHAIQAFWSLNDPTTNWSQDSQTCYCQFKAIRKQSANWYKFQRCLAG